MAASRPRAGEGACDDEHLLAALAKARRAESVLSPVGFKCEMIYVLCIQYRTMRLAPFLARSRCTMELSTALVAKLQFTVYGQSSRKRFSPRFRTDPARTRVRQWRPSSRQPTTTRPVQGEAGSHTSLEFEHRLAYRRRPRAKRRWARLDGGRGGRVRARVRVREVKRSKEKDECGVRGAVVLGVVQ
eukprot:scaffold70519_cov69-Phaeocystis_antarctica.AAC.1